MVNMINKEKIRDLFISSMPLPLFGALLGAYIYLLFGAPKIEEIRERKAEAEGRIEYVAVRGEVIKEQYNYNKPFCFIVYIPPSHEYYFSMETEQGERKLVYVKEKSRGKDLKTLDFLIDPGTRVGVKVDKNKIGQERYIVGSDKVRILE